ncbi:hypothetical protein F5I97DRAFT_1189719 [Phlebopus sp. FC_14]|nr:hypothetical protein F5I97DRAFT_1189719 [Phlebopus sp. FC_14]
MDGWVDYLHVGFLGEHVLLSSFKLDSFSAFFLSSVVISVICFSERDVHPRWTSRSRLANAWWKSALYGLVTLLRLLYMLAAMSYQLGAIAVVVIALSIAQFTIEYLDHREVELDRHVEEPLLRNSFSRHHPRATRPDARSRPAAMFIHPYESNLARAEAAALELSVAGDTDLVNGNESLDDRATWQHGKGREVARELLGDPQRSRNAGFDVGAEDEG